jgi:hypothetical protein
MTITEPSEEECMKRPSASNVESFVMCGASHVLPQHEAYLERTEKGTDGHKLLADYFNANIGGEERLRKAQPGLIEALEPFMPMTVSAEWAYVVDVEKRSSIYVGQDIGRDYARALGRELGPYEIGCTLDVWAKHRGRPVAWLRDFKFGNHSSWWQLHIQAMAILWQPNISDAEVDAGFLHIHADSDGPPVVTEDQATLYLSDLDDRADEIMKAFAYAKTLDASNPAGMRTVEGKWCQYCGAFPHCPSKWKLAKAALDLDVVGSIAALTVEQCGAAWKKFAEIERNIIDKGKAALRERMKVEGGFPLENGKRLKVIQAQGRESLDRTKLQALLLKYEIPREEVDEIFTQGKPYDMVKEVKG